MTTRGPLPGAAAVGAEVTRLDYRVFTVREADRLLPHLREVLEEIRATREEARRHHEKLQVLDALWGEEVTQAENPDHEAYEAHRRGISEARKAIRVAVESEIRARGIRFPVGGLEHGLLDFPSSYRGRWVYLCWRRGESAVGHWHEVDAGYRGRRPITAEQAAMMGREDDRDELDDSVLDF